jgi:KipI family sensor histidine kinase inhibitor
MVGFAPGHPYLGGLAPSLSVPRRSAPRVKMPCGAVAIANAQCVVYPFEIPGGWSVVGRTPLRVFDANRPQPSLFEPGDQVRFERIDRGGFDELARQEGTE